MTPLAAQGICKRYREHVVLDGVELTVAPGEVLALVGPNGTGKSTLIGCVCGTVIPDQGRVTIGGHDLARAPLDARRALRYLPQETDAPVGMTGDEILAFYADVFKDPDGMSRAREMASLGPAMGELATTYSVGMRKRLMFAALTFGEAALYVLDEPFAGVDAEGRTRMQAWLGRRKAAGAGLLLAAHDADDPELSALGARRHALAKAREGGA